MWAPVAVSWALATIARALRENATKVEKDRMAIGDVPSRVYIIENWAAGIAQCVLARVVLKDGGGRDGSQHQDGYEKGEGGE